MQSRPVILCFDAAEHTGRFLRRQCEAVLVTHAVKLNVPVESLCDPVHA